MSTRLQLQRMEHNIEQNRRVVRVQLEWLKMFLRFIHVQFVWYALCVHLTYASNFKLWHTSINIHWVKQPIERKQLPTISQPYTKILHWVKQPIERKQLLTISQPYTRYKDTIPQLVSLLLLL